ncbi:hypothetical protein Dimus_024746 [Dionaea muscipula]
MDFFKSIEGGRGQFVGGVGVRPGSAGASLAATAVFAGEVGQWMRVREMQNVCRQWVERRGENPASADVLVVVVEEEYYWEKLQRAHLGSSVHVHLGNPKSPKLYYQSPL